MDIEKGVSTYGYRHNNITFHPNYLFSSFNLSYYQKTEEHC